MTRKYKSKITNKIHILSYKNSNFWLLSAYNFFDYEYLILELKFFLLIIYELNKLNK